MPAFRCLQVPLRRLDNLDLPTGHFTKRSRYFWTNCAFPFPPRRQPGPTEFRGAMAAFLAQELDVEVAPRRPGPTLPVRVVRREPYLRGHSRWYWGTLMHSAQSGVWVRCGRCPRTRFCPHAIPEAEFVPPPDYTPNAVLAEDARGRRYVMNLTLEELERAHGLPAGYTDVRACVARGMSAADVLTLRQEFLGDMVTLQSWQHLLRCVPAATEETLARGHWRNALHAKYLRDLERGLAPPDTFTQRCYGGAAGP